ncbi:OmpH family outer membrane protein [Gangjinia marincola]|uniref:OmpH family outer membrane protein n=1 Tax=Gangjinia marincola TaxID=578463 RepID=A0ABP3XQ73_9FLAO
MKRIGSFLILVIVLCNIHVSKAQRGMKIGYIDMEYILQNVPEYQEANIQLDQKVQRWKNDIDKKMAEIEDMKTDLKNEKPLLTPTLIEERQEEIDILEDAMFKYQQDRFGPTGDLMIQKRQLVQPVQDQVFAAVQDLGLNKKFDFIFDRSDVSMLYSNDRHDISDQILKKIQRTSKQNQATAKKDDESEDEDDYKSVAEAEADENKEQERQQKEKDRQALIAERTRKRDSTRQAKQAAFEARRDSILAARQKRRDSILEARKKKNEEPDGGN